MTERHGPETTAAYRRFFAAWLHGGIVADFGHQRVLDYPTLPQGGDVRRQYRDFCRACTGSAP